MKVSIKNFSDLLSHPDCRWDSEYLCLEPHKSESLTYVPIGNVLASSQYGVSIEMNDEGIGTRIYRMNEIGNVFCDRTVLKSAHLDPDKVSSYSLNDKDVLFNRTNSPDFVGRTALFRQFTNEDIAFASYLVRINPRPEMVAPEYLTAFLNTKYGMLDVKRRARISINQSNVNAEELKRVEIPLVSNRLQSRIVSTFDAAFNSIQSSEVKYRQAELSLKSEFDLADWQPHHQLSFVTTFCNAWHAGRIDADHFQPRYEHITAAIKKHPSGWETLGNLASIRDMTFSPMDASEYKYIELANIGANGEIASCMVALGKDLPSRARRKVTTGDVIISSIEGSLDSIALIDSGYDQAVCSTGFHVVKSTSLNSETLVVLLKSVVGQLQLKKGCSGTILTAINKAALKEIVLPLVSEETQAQIQQLVTQSYDLRQASKRLLTCAKRAVEVAIEKDERTAIAWLDSEVPLEANQTAP